MLYSQDDPPVPYLVERARIVSARDLVDAQATYDPQTQRAGRLLPLRSEGRRALGEATQQNVGKPFAIVLDNQVISAPLIREPILGGPARYPGNFTAQSANDLASCFAPARCRRR